MVKFNDLYFFPTISVFLSLFRSSAVLDIELRVFYTLGKCSTKGLYPQYPVIIF